MGKNSLKTIIIVIMALIIIGFIGYVVYDKTINKNNIENYKTQVEELQKQVQELKNSKNTEATTNDITGYYKTGNLSEPHLACEKGLEETTEIHILENGTFEKVYSSNCDAADQSGTWTYQNNKLILTCDNHSEQCPEGDTIEYVVNEDGSLTGSKTSRETNSKEIYTKVSQQSLQVLNK